MRRAIALTGLTSASSPELPRKFGRLTLEGYSHHTEATGEKLAVWLDGQDITKRCREADDIEGWADVFFPIDLIVKLGNAGWPSYMRRYGNVVIGPAPRVLTQREQTLSMVLLGWIMYVSGENKYIFLLPACTEPGSYTVYVTGTVPYKAGITAGFSDVNTVEISDVSPDWKAYRVDYQVWRTEP